MYWNEDEICNLPEILTLNDVSIFCHISKMTARYFLKSGLLKCTDSGNKTRCYSIKKAHLILFLKDYEKHPNDFKRPKNWYKNQGKMYLNHIDSPRHFSAFNELERREAKKYFQAALKKYPNLLTVKQVIAFTGYGKTTVQSWLNTQKLKHLCSKKRNLIPKITLIEFLISENYSKIRVKSKVHLEQMRRIYQKLNEIVLQKGEQKDEL